MAKVTTTADAVEMKRAKWAQTLTNQASLDPASSYADLALLFFKHLSLVVVVLFSTCTKTLLLSRELISLQNLKHQPWAMPGR